jgi:hypothetical protein
MSNYTLRTVAHLFAIDFMKRKSVKVLEAIHQFALEERLSLREELDLIRLFEECL